MADSKSKQIYEKKGALPQLTARFKDKSSAIQLKEKKKQRTKVISTSAISTTNGYGYLSYFSFHCRELHLSVTVVHVKSLMECNGLPGCTPNLTRKWVLLCSSDMSDSGMEVTNDESVFVCVHVCACVRVCEGVGVCGAR